MLNIKSTGESETFSIRQAPQVAMIERVKNCDISEFWNAWSSWTACSQICNYGTRNRTRTCAVSSGCYADESESENCIIKTCGKLLLFYSGKRIT